MRERIHGNLEQLGAKGPVAMKMADWKAWYAGEHPSQTEKEEMAQINMKPFVHNSGQFEIHTSMPQNVQDAMVLASERRAAAQAEALADVLEEQMADDEAVRELLRANIRCFRRSIKATVAQLDALDWARAFFTTTGNPLPWLVATGRVHNARECGLTNAEYAELSVVPKGWTPTTGPTMAELAE